MCPKKLLGGSIMMLLLFGIFFAWRRRNRQLVTAELVPTSKPVEQDAYIMLGVASKEQV